MSIEAGLPKRRLKPIPNFEKMKIELVKQTTKITGTPYWYVKADGVMVSGTFTGDPDKAVEKLNEVREGAIKFPETVEEIISVEEV